MRKRRNNKRISRIRLYNFQSYLNETIEFNAETNAIVGKTDVGKTAITRALYWALYNRPVRSGGRDDFTTWGKNHCFVTVCFSDGCEITRGRKEGENYYILKSPNLQEPLEFKGFGTEVPRQILEAHGMHRLSFGDGTNISLNISQQLDPIFLFEDGGPKRAKTIGKVSGADKTDGAIPIVQSWYRDAQTNKRRITKEILNTKQELNEFDFLDNLSTSIKSLEELIHLVKDREDVKKTLEARVKNLKELELHKQELLIILALDSKYIDLNECIEKLLNIRKRKEEISVSYSTYNNLLKEREIAASLINIEDKVTTLEEYLITIQNKRKLINEILTHLHRFNEYEEQISKLVLILEKANTLAEVYNTLDLLKERIVRLNNIRTSFNNYIELSKRKAKGSSIIESLENKLRETQKQYKACLEEVKVCPLCNSDLSKEQIERVEGNV